MIISKNVPLEKQIKFMAANVRKIPTAEELRRMCKSDSIANGLLSYRSLLDLMFSDAECLEGKNDDAKHDNLIATLNFLFACFLKGKVAGIEGIAALIVDKAMLLEKYKKGGIAQKIRLLNQCGLTVSWLSENGEEVSQRNASSAVISYERDDLLVPAVKEFVSAIEATGADHRESPDKQFICCMHHLFAKADFETAYLKTALTRDEMNPLREDVLATAGRLGKDWSNLADLLVNELDLLCAGFFYYEAGPSWVIRFSQQAKTSFLIVNLGYESPFIELTLPVDNVEKAIRQRSNYSVKVLQKIESLKCTNCDSKCSGEKIVHVDGVALCKKNAYNRRIYLMLSLKEDFRSIEAIAKHIYS
jgi:hypothetical protein